MNQVENDLEEIFSEDFSNINLDVDIKEAYDMFANAESKKDFDNQVELAKIRDENYRRYCAINITKYKNLPDIFGETKDQILNLYKCIDVKNILEANYAGSKNIKIILNSIYSRIYRLDSIAKTYLKELVVENDTRQKKFSRAYFDSLNISESAKKDLIEKYNDLVLYSSGISKDIYIELKIQCDRKDRIDQILKVLNDVQKETLDNVNREKLEPINLVIGMEIDKYKAKIRNLDSMILPDSEYYDEYEQFKSFFEKLIDYDRNNYENAKQVFDILTSDDRLKGSINKFSNTIDSAKKNIVKTTIDDDKKLEKLKEFLKNIIQYYSSTINANRKNILEKIWLEANDDNPNIEELYIKVSMIFDIVWRNQITNVYSYNPNEDYYFICSNNQFMDEQYPAILITRQEIEKANNYENYQIGFICDYDNNILYTTHMEDFMAASQDDRFDLKLPFEVEEEFTNFKTCRKLILDGRKTKIKAVYLINDGDMEKYIKAVELADMYKIPLIEFKK